jgi:hypothetical protein
MPLLLRRREERHIPEVKDCAFMQIIHCSMILKLGVNHSQTMALNIDNGARASLRRAFDSSEFKRRDLNIL